MIVLDTSAIQAELLQVLRRAEDFVPVFDYVADHVMREVKNRIEHTKLSPDGAPFAAWRPFTEDVRHTKGNEAQGILWDTGELLNSFYVEIEGSFEMSLGTDVEYAIDVQEGIEGKQEARPYLGWSEDDIFTVGRASFTYLTTGIPA